MLPSPQLWYHGFVYVIKDGGMLASRTFRERRPADSTRTGAATHRARVDYASAGVMAHVGAGYVILASL